MHGAITDDIINDVIVQQQVWIFHGRVQEPLETSLHVMHGAMRIMHGAITQHQVCIFHGRVQDPLETSLCVMHDAMRVIHGAITQQQVNFP